MALPRYYSRANARANKTHSSVTIAVVDEATKKRLLHHGLMIASEKCKTGDFIPVRPTDTCSNCLGWGHHWSYCKQTSPRCKLCKESHQTRDHICPTCSVKGKTCKHHRPVCFRCNGAHLATSPQCEIYQQHINTSKRNRPSDTEEEEYVDQLQQQLQQQLLHTSSQSSNTAISPASSPPASIPEPNDTIMSDEQC